MTLSFRDNVKMDVWNRMPASKFLLGRKRVFSIVEHAVAGWPMSGFNACRDMDEYAEASKDYAASLAKNEFGSVLALLFIGLITALVQVLLEWWLLGKTYNDDFAMWRADLQ